MLSHPFVKYHGLGNDFVVMAPLPSGEVLAPERVQALCDRRRGIGADGILTVWPHPGTAGRMQVQNCDGSEPEMCGNGLRCVAAYLRDSGTPPEALASAVGTHAVRFIGDDIEITMGAARFAHVDLPTVNEAHVVTLAPGLHGVPVSMGNPHAVIFTEASPHALGQEHGAALAQHPAFPRGVNVSFARRTGNAFETFVHERGVGPTDACGSAACAVAAASVLTGQTPAEALHSVHLPGGELRISVGADFEIAMGGPAVRVFEGSFPLPV